MDGWTDEQADRMDGCVCVCVRACVRACVRGRNYALFVHIGSIEYMGQMRNISLLAVSFQHIYPFIIPFCSHTEY